MQSFLIGYLKLMYPDGEFTKEELEEVIQIALEMCRRVKEQLKKPGGMEFYDVNFSYSDAQITMNIYNHIAEMSHVENEMSKINLPETVPAVV